MSRQVETRRIIEIAILAANGLSQREIADHIRIDRSAVSRTLKKAEELGYIKFPPAPDPVLIEKGIPPGVLDELRFRDLQIDIRNRLQRFHHCGKPLVHHVTIIHTSNLGTDHESWQKRIHVLVQATAERFLELLPNMEQIGIAWGSNLRALHNEVRRKCNNRPIPKRARPKLIIPIGCEPLFFSSPIEVTASEIARDFAETLHVEGRHWSLSPVPAFIPKEFHGEQRVLRDLFSKVPDYEAIFGPTGSRHKGLVAKLDTIITSMAGVIKKYKDGSPWTQARFEAEQGVQQSWTRLLAGDMAGVLFARTQLPGPDRAKASAMAEEINSRNLGLLQSDFQKCARASADSSGRRPGVFVLAHGRSKTDILLAAIEAQCVNQVVIDKDLADRLVEMI